MNNEVVNYDRLTVKVPGAEAYEIVYEASFDRLSDELEKFDIANKKIAIITDSNVEKLYAKAVSEVLYDKCQKVCVYAFEAGEESKNLDTIHHIYRFLINMELDRNDLLIALGGGVVGDMCGFVAATYLRGVSFVQIPTTLLSQVDSSIGGKTGVDFDNYKNMIGAFKMPVLVYSNISTLSSLDDRQFASGMGEVLKHGLIRNADYFVWTISNLYEISDKDTQKLKELVYKSNIIKKEIVEKDPYEKGDRALLNFGHTLGHAIEKYMNFSLAHGECVALGCIAAAYISYKRNILKMEEYYELRDMFVPFNLPITITDVDINEVVKLTKSDKKKKGDHIKFVLLKKIGKAFLAEDVTDEEMVEAVKEIYFDEAAND